MQAFLSIRHARRVLAALLLASGAAAAQAASFSFTGFTDSGPLTGQAFSGSFSYDEPLSGFDGSVALQAFALDFAGNAYNLATADASTTPVAAFAAGSFIGIDFQDTATLDLDLRPQVQFTAGFFDLNQAFFSYVGRDALGSPLQGFGSYSVSAVPEPAGLALALAGLTTLAALRRRRG